MKLCTKCKKEKLPIEFHFRTESSDGLKYWCKACCNEMRTKHYYKNLKREQNTLLMRRFGISLKQYEEILLTQEGVCAICKREEIPGKRLAVDHVSNSNPAIVRGLLCFECNTAIGKFNDSPFRLRRAAEYLEKQTVK